MNPSKCDAQHQPQVLGAEGKVVIVEEDTPGSACYVGVGGPFVKDGACVAAWLYAQHAPRLLVRPTAVP